VRDVFDALPPGPRRPRALPGTLVGLMITWWVIGTAASIALIGGLVYVALHFVAKFW
jgi:hypothetical protein